MLFIVGGELGQLVDERAGEHGAPRRLAAERGLEIDRTARPIAERRQERRWKRYVEPDAGDDMHAALSLRSELEQDAAELALVVDEIVRPLQSDREPRDAVEHAAHGDSDGERERGRLRGHARELPPDGQADAAAEGHAPAPAAPAATVRLEFRDADVEQPVRRRHSQQPAVRGIDFGMDLELREPRGDVGRKRRTQSVRVEQVEPAR